MKPVVFLDHCDHAQEFGLHLIGKGCGGSVEI